MATFALVHGACHGAWCWQRLVPELEALGHHAAVMDLPTEDPTAGCVRYAEGVVDALRGVEDDVVVVGHSLAGLTIPLVAAARPVRRLTFLCAFPAEPGLSFRQQDHGGRVPWVKGAPPVAEHDDGTFSFGEAFARAVLYPDCSEDDRLWAMARLRRQTTTPHGEVCPLERWPPVESRYILATEDLAVNPDWARWVARERLAVEPIELHGGHSPFLARPAELAHVLTRGL